MPVEERQKENISINLTTHVMQTKQRNTRQSWRQQTDMDDRGTLTKKTVTDVVCAPCNVFPSDAPVLHVLSVAACCVGLRDKVVC